MTEVWKPCLKVKIVLLSQSTGSVSVSHLMAPDVQCS